MVAALIAVSLLVSCTSLKPVESADIHRSLSAGDSVRVVTKKGQQIEFEVVAVTAEAIVGKEQRIELADIRELQKREISPGKTAGLVAAILGAVVVVVLLVSFASGAGAVAFGGAH